MGRVHKPCQSGTETTWELHNPADFPPGVSPVGPHKPPNGAKEPPGGSWSHRSLPCYHMRWRGPSACCFHPPRCAQQPDRSGATSHLKALHSRLHRTTVTNESDRSQKGPVGLWDALRHRAGSSEACPLGVPGTPGTPGTHPSKRLSELPSQWSP